MLFFYFFFISIRLKVLHQFDNLSALMCEILSIIFHRCTFQNYYFGKCIESCKYGSGHMKKIAHLYSLYTKKWKRLLEKSALLGVCYQEQQRFYSWLHKDGFSCKEKPTLTFSQIQASLQV